MTHYAVYGIGNALVDLEYQIETADLAALGIDKGVMTLMDAPQQSALMHQLAGRPHQREPGGSAANSVIAVCQFGSRSFYSCKVADDELGQFYQQELRTSGVDTSALTASKAALSGHTGRCVVLVTPDSDRTLCTFLGISGELSEQDLVTDALCDSTYLYLEGYLVTSASARRACHTARHLAQAAGVKTAFSLSDPNMVRFFKPGLLDMIGAGVDVLFANEEEAKGMAETDDLQQALAYLQTLGREGVITRGPHGALLWDGPVLREIAPVPVQALDTVGAGDMFAGAFLYGRCQGWQPQRAAALASAAAAEVVTRFGPHLPLAVMQALLHRFQSA